MAAIIFATPSDSVSGSASTSASPSTSLSVFAAVLVGHHLVPWSSDQPVCFLVSLALPLVACQPMHQKVIWPQHYAVFLPSTLIASVSVSIGVSASISLSVLVTLLTFTSGKV